MTKYGELKEAIVKYKKNRVADLTEQAVKAGDNAWEIMEKGFLDGLDIVDKKITRDQMFIPELLMAAKAAQKGIDVLKPHMPKNRKDDKKTAVVGTVKGDFHATGKTIITLMAEWLGLNIIDIGMDVSCEQFFEKAEKHNADLICLLAFQSNISPVTIAEIKKMETLGKQKNVDKKAKVLIASQAISKQYSQEIGVDAYANNAVSAFKKARGLIYQ